MKQINIYDLAKSMGCETTTDIRPKIKVSNGVVITIHVDHCGATLWFWPTDEYSVAIAKMNFNPEKYTIEKLAKSITRRLVDDADNIEALLSARMRYSQNVKYDGIVEQNTKKLIALFPDLLEVREDGRDNGLRVRKFNYLNNLRITADSVTAQGTSLTLQQFAFLSLAATDLTDDLAMRIGDGDAAKGRAIVAKLKEVLTI